MGATVIFPNLGITINDLPSGFTIGTFRIAFYGILIAIGMVLAVFLAMRQAKKTNQNTDDYVDIGIISIIAAIIGARIYYVLFRLDEFDSFADVINIRNGGLAIYGGIIAGILATYFVCVYKKISFMRILDTAVPGIAIAQAIGRWGNFFNLEAYGGYTDSLFAMQIKYSAANGVVSEELLNNLKTVDGVTYIQVHPTFLYESVWCLLLFIVIRIFSKYQKYNGEVVLWYIGGYALERAFVEGLRTDQLQFADGIAVSQLLSIALLAGSFALLLINRIRLASKKWVPNFKLVLEDGDPGTTAYKKALKEKRKKSKGKTWETYTVGKEDQGEKPEEPEAEETEKPEETAEEPEKSEEN